MKKIVVAGMCLFTSLILAGDLDDGIGAESEVKPSSSELKRDFSAIYLRRKVKAKLNSGGNDKDIIINGNGKDIGGMNLGTNVGGLNAVGSDLSNSNIYIIQENQGDITTINE